MNVFTGVSRVTLTFHGYELGCESVFVEVFFFFQQIITKMRRYTFTKSHKIVYKLFFIFIY